MRGGYVVVFIQSKYTVALVKFRHLLLPVGYLFSGYKLGGQCEVAGACIVLYRH
jgi:hypothetical protein